MTPEAVNLHALVVGLCMRLCLRLRCRLPFSLLQVQWAGFVR